MFCWCLEIVEIWYKLLVCILCKLDPIEKNKKDNPVGPNSSKIPLSTNL